MELLIIMAVREFVKDIKLLLKKSGVSTFSYTHVSGYKDLSDQPMESNWFASNVGEYESVLFYTFVKKGNVAGVIKAIEEFNAKLESMSKIHVAVMDVKQTNII
jgi:nitrogen regulatory protein PII